MAEPVLFTSAFVQHLLPTREEYGFGLQSFNVSDCHVQVGRVIYAVKDLQANNTQDLWLPVKPLLKQDKVR